MIYGTDGTCATLVSMEQEQVYNGQVRYRLVFEDVPLDDGDFTWLRDVITNRTRLFIEMSEA